MIRHERRTASVRMYPDVLELKEFYRSPLGHLARRILTCRVRARWREARGCAMLGIGYPTPFLQQYLNEAARLTALMPQAQGVLPWPAKGPHVTVLADETHLPLPDSSFDRILIVHCLEHTAESSQLLREVWRVLTPEGRLIVIAPNRRGLWARAEATPFGHGRPYSRAQIEMLLRQALFVIEGVCPALFAPPIAWRPVLSAAVGLERLGAYLWPIFSGILIVEAAKQVYAALPVTEGVKRKPARLVTIHNGAARRCPHPQRKAKA